MNLHARSTPSYLISTPYSYYFRIRIPEDLQLHFDHRHEIRRSLKTGYLSEAKLKAQLIAGQMRKLFRHLRRRRKDFHHHQAMTTTLTSQMIKELITQFIQDSFDGFEEEMLGRKRPLTPEQLDDKAKGYWWVSGDTKEALATGDYAAVHHTVDNLLEHHGIELVEKDSLDYRKLCRKILKAQVKVLERLEKRVYGNYDDDDDDEEQTALNQHPPTYQPEKQTSDTIKQAADDYWNEYSRNIKPRSRIDYKGYLDHIVSYFKPETRLHEIEYGVAL